MTRHDAMRRQRRGRCAAAVAGMLAVMGSVAAGCGSEEGSGTDRSGSTSGAVDERTPVVIDTDGGSDDAMAILYLLQHPEVEVLGITVSGTGIVHCDPGVANVEGLVELAAPGADVPVACGRTEPLEGAREFPADWRAQADGRYDGLLPAGVAPARDVDAVELLTETLEDATRPVTVLTLGPLTNVADALLADPQLVVGIDRVVAMAGAFEVDGNVFRDDEPEAASTEWNVYVDPAAAQAVLDSGARVTFVPLDSQVPVDPFLVRALADGATTPPARLVSDLLRSSPFFTSGQFFLWDPLAAAAVADPTDFGLRAVDVAVTGSGPQAGRTVAGAGASAEIADVVRPEAFVSSFLGVLDGRPTPLEVPRSSDTVVTVAPDACRLTDDTIDPGPRVVSIGLLGVAAIGTIEPGRTDEEIESYLAGGPTEPPPWFDLVALLQSSGSEPASVLLDVPPGELTVLCVSLGGGLAAVTGRATLTVRSSTG